MRGKPASSQSPADQGYHNPNSSRRDPKTGSPLPANYDTVTGAPGGFNIPVTYIPPGREPRHGPGYEGAARVDPGEKGPLNPADNIPLTGIPTGLINTDLLNPNPLPPARVNQGDWPYPAKPSKGPKGSTTGGNAT